MPTTKNWLSEMTSSFGSGRARAEELTAANEQLRREIAQRELAEAEVRRLNTELQLRYAELQTLFNLMPVGVGIATDATGDTIRFNSAYAEMHGLPHSGNVTFSSPPMSVPRTFRTFHDGRELAHEETPIVRAVTTNAPVRDFEKTIARQDGSTVEVLANAVPIRDASGQPTGCVATFQDITTHKQGERRRLDFERKLQQSQKLESIGVLAGGIAHDFNNLLTGILGHANLARSQVAAGDHDVDALLEQVELSAQRAAELCRRLLAYAGKGRFIVKPIDLNVVIQQALPLLRLSISKKITLDLQLADVLPPFRGDATQLNQVLMNLAINASEAIGDKVGTVTIRSRRTVLAAMDLITLTSMPEMQPGPCVCLEVTDTGCGISPEAMPHIFEPFFSTKFVGRGLGLPAVLGIVQGHHGGLRCTSEVGKGTTFELYFPLVTPPATSHLPAANLPASARSAPARGLVLVVDDEEPVRKLAMHALNAAGFTVVTAENGEEALTHLRRGAARYDAVLLDLIMPKLDGEDTFMALHMLAPNLPVILTSGFHDQRTAQRFVSRGLAGFLPKPFTADELVSRIVELVPERLDT